MPDRRRRSGRAAALLLGTGFLILVALGATTLFLVHRTQDYAEASIRAQQARVTAGRIYSLLSRAESAQRGYLLTDDPSYLQPYEDAATLLPAAMANFGQYGDILPDGMAVQARLFAAVEAKLEELASTVELQRTGRHDEAMRVVLTDDGQQRMEQAADLLTGIARALDALRTAERDRLFGRAQTLLHATWAGLGLALLVASAAFAVVLRYARLTDLARQEVTAANASLEQRVRERTAELESANEEVGRFAYIVSHDLRAPLVNVMGFTAELEAGLAAMRDLLAAADARAPGLVGPEARVAVEEDVPEAIGFIRSSTQRMDRLINAILRLSREGRRSLTPEPVAMAELFNTIATSVRHQLDEADAEIVIAGPMPDLVSDRLALEQVFGNLVDNAVKYLDRSRPGRVVVSGAVAGPGPQAGLRYTVRDNGRGIEPRDRERVFELFRRAGVQDRPGEGIGLAHVRALVRRLGGTIDFDSRPGHGTAFTVRLPHTLAAGPSRTGKEVET